MRRLRKSPDGKHARYGNVKLKVPPGAERFTAPLRTVRRDEREVLVRMEMTSTPLLAAGVLAIEWWIILL